MVDGSISTDVLHAELCRLASCDAELHQQIARCLLQASRARLHQQLGFATLSEYAERVLGFSPRQTAEHVRTAAALESLPVMEHALRSAELSWSAARELVRVATPDTEHEWLAHAKGRTAREIERKVSGHQPGDRPNDPPDPRLRRCVLRLELSAETEALYREACNRVRREVEHALNEDEILAELLQRALARGRDDGTAPYQVAFTTCAHCLRSYQDGGADAIPVPAEVAERAACDAQHIGRVDSTHVGHDAPTHVGHDAPTHVGHDAPTHVGHDAPTHVGRASQTVPPATRRLVVRRAHGKCQVPGCRNVLWLEVHHVQLRSEGGGHDPERLVVLCGTHHRLAHEGRLCVHGGASEGLRFEHGDGTPYGELPSPAAIDANVSALAALRNLGYREGEAKRLLALARTHVGQDPSWETLVRAALRRAA